MGMGRTQCESTDPDEGLEAHEEKGPHERGILGAAGKASSQYRIPGQGTAGRAGCSISHVKAAEKWNRHRGRTLALAFAAVFLPNLGVLYCILGSTRQGMYQILCGGGMIAGWHGSREVVEELVVGMRTPVQVPESEPLRQWLWGMASPC